MMGTFICWVFGHRWVWGAGERPAPQIGGLHPRYECSRCGRIKLRWRQPMAMKSKRKGKTGELEVAALIRQYGFTAERGVQYEGGHGSPDVRTNMQGVHIEVKRCEQLNLWDAIKQARADAYPQETAIVFHRKNDRPWLVIMTAENFMELMKDLHDVE